MNRLIAQAEQLLPQAVRDARDQELTWAQIGELRNTTAAAARRYGTSHDQLDKDHRHNAANWKTSGRCAQAGNDHIKALGLVRF